jgi:hypothetical protein
MSKRLIETISKKLKRSMRMTFNYIDDIKKEIEIIRRNQEKFWSLEVLLLK